MATDRLCSPVNFSEFTHAFRFFWIVLVLCCGTIVSAQSNPEQEKLRSEFKAAYVKGDYEKCKELTTKDLALNPKDHLALYLRASSRVELGFVSRDGAEVRSGIEDARESLKIGGGGEIDYYLPYLLGMITLANIEDKKEHANVALEISKSVLARTNLTPEQRANILYQRASAHLYLKESSGAIEDFQAAIKAFPGHIGSYMRLAETYMFSGQTWTRLRRHLPRRWTPFPTIRWRSTTEGCSCNSTTSEKKRSTISTRPSNWLLIRSSC